LAPSLVLPCQSACFHEETVHTETTSILSVRVECGSPATYIEQKSCLTLPNA
jgi:hypothetical protein